MVDLPPIPDRSTGEPRPPKAPRREISRTYVEHTPTDRVPKNPPPLPEGVGPVLEWSQGTRKDAWKATFACWAFGAIAFTVMNGFAWLTVWIPWLYFPAIWWAMFRVMKLKWLAVGSVWVQDRRGWVNLYELTRIRFAVDGLNRVLRLDDSAGRELDQLYLRDAQANSAMWDLIYNGILHSVASGNCEISEKARAVLRLPTDVGR